MTTYETPSDDSLMTNWTRDSENEEASADIRTPARPWWRGDTFPNAVMALAAGLAGCFLIVLFVYCWATGDGLGDRITRFGLSLAVVGASVAVGALAGFLFGVPLFTEDTKGAKPLSGTRLVMNSNLGQVSDWLTKIVIGIGLIQFTTIVHGIGWIGESYARALGATTPGESSEAMFAEASVVIGVAVAFIFEYLFVVSRLPEVWNLRALEGHEPEPVPQPPS
jgi:hypothetical protein